MSNENIQLEPVAVKGTNLKNSLYICGGLLLAWYLYKSFKKR